MLVEINLLPQKEAKNKPLFRLAIISIVILLIGGFFAYWLNRSYENKIDSLQQQINMTEQLVVAEQEKVTAYEASSSLAKLEKTVKWAQEYPIKTVPVLNELTSLLPERGFLQTFTYEEMGLVNFSVQFETSREAAFYLSSIQESNLIASAKLLSLNAITSFYDKKFGEEMDESKLKNEKYVPRYLAEFEITLDQAALKKEVEANSSEESEEDES